MPGLRHHTRKPLVIRAVTFTSVLLLALTSAIHAQLIVPNNGETLPTFEVETVKPSSRDLGRSFHIHIWRNDNSYRTENTTLRDLIRDAFDAHSTAQLIGGTDALLDSRWDINAKVGDEEYAKLQKLPRDDGNRAIHLMLQALLADRFGLKVQIATRELPVFDLVLEKGDSKLQPAISAAPAQPHAEGSSSTNVGREQATMTVSAASLAILTAMLGRQPELDGRIVVDKTGLRGQYSWTLQWQPQRLSGATDPDATGPALFTALREQLGLKLEPSKGPVQVVVIDEVSDPTPN